jgi:lysophospholipase L1-like esterase
MKTLGRILLKVFFFFLFLEAFFHVGGGFFLLMQSLTDNVPIEKSSPIQKKEYRILCLGDSMTAGGGLKSYPKLTEDILNRNKFGIHFVVINRAAPGQASINLASFLNSFINEFNPDIIVTMMGNVDAVYVSQRKDSFQGRLKMSLLENVKTIRFIKRLIDSLRPDLRGKFDQGAEEFSKLRTDDEGRQAAGVKEKNKNRNVVSFDYNANQDSSFQKLEIKNPEDLRIAEYKLKFLLHPGPLMVNGFNDFVEIARARGKKVVIVQYPLVSIVPLKNIVKFKKDVVFVENLDNFHEAIKTAPREMFFGDLITPLFGHCTDKGNELIAENLAAAIFSLVRSK